MFTIRVDHDLDKLVSKLSVLARDQVPYAASVAINKTAEVVRSAASLASRSAMTAKPFTTGEGAFYIKRSSKTDLVAEIGYKDLQARYMKWQTGGGQRVAKAFEVKLQSMGVLPIGYVTVPGAVKLDGYGNIPKSALVAIIGQLSASVRVFAGRGKRMHGEVLFVVKPGNVDRRTARLHPGIWQRLESGGVSGIRPLILFVSHAQYQAGKFFDYRGVASKTVAEEFPKQFEQAMTMALETAR